MATHRIPIIGAMTVPDSTGECYFDNVNNQMTLGTSAARNLVVVLKDPTADTGFYGSFTVPKNYVGTPVIVVRGILDGTVGATSADFEFSYVALADNESFEAGWVESVTFNSGNTNGWADEDVIEVSGSCSANFAVDDDVFFYFKRDQGTDDFVGDFHVTGLFFQYADS
jgi:hypothetical protein